MTQQHKRRAVIISGTLTALVMTLVGGLVFANGWLKGPTGGTEVDNAGRFAGEAPIVVTVQPLAPALDTAAIDSEAANVDVPTDGIIAAYQSQLQEANQALQEAYDQIDLLQSAQNQQTITRRYQSDDDQGEHGWEYEEYEDD